MVASLWIGATLAMAVPEIDRPVVDLAEVIEPAQEDAIAAELVEHRERTGVQLAVLIVPSTLPQDIADYAQDVFDGWGGGSAERDDGALFVLAVEDRRSRLHLGYGLEPVISDAAAKEMLDDLRPALQAGAYGDAAAQLVDDVRTATAHLRPGEPIAAPLGATRWLWALIGLLAGLLGVAWGTVSSKAVRAVSKGKRKRMRVKGRGGRWRRRRFVRTHLVSRDRSSRIVAAAVVVMFAAIALLLSGGIGFAFAYLLSAALYFALGWLTGVTPRTFGIAFAVSVLAGLVLGLIAAFNTIPDGFDGFAIAGHAGLVVFITFIGGGMLSMCVWGGMLASSAGGGSGGSSYGSGYSTNYRSSYGSSYGSSSSSYGSSDYGSSSSYDYSGGGGSSGGGGASSSW